MSVARVFFLWWPLFAQGSLRRLEATGRGGWWGLLPPGPSGGGGEIPFSWPWVRMGGGVVAGVPPPVQHGREELCTHKLHVPLLDRKEVRGDACDDADGPAGNEEEAVSAWRCRVRDVVLLGQARSLGPDRGLPRDGQGQGGSHAAQARLESPDRCLNGRAGVASGRKRVVDCEGRSG